MNSSAPTLYTKASQIFSVIAKYFVYQYSTKINATFWNVGNIRNKSNIVLQLNVSFKDSSYTLIKEVYLTNNTFAEICQNFLKLTFFNGLF